MNSSKRCELCKNKIKLFTKRAKGELGTPIDLNYVTCKVRGEERIIHKKVKCCDYVLDNTLYELNMDAWEWRVKDV